MRTGIYVSGGAGRLRKLLQQDDSVVIPSVRVVFSDDMRNTDLQPLLASKGIGFLCIDHTAFLPKERSLRISDALLGALQQHRVDYCYCFGDRLLKGTILSVFADRIVNFHPSILPAFPGRHAIDRALEANAFLLGNTAHFVDAGVDTGPVIMQSVMLASVFREKSYDGVLDVQLDMLRAIHGWLAEGRVSMADGRVHIAGIAGGHVTLFPSDQE